MKYFSFLAQYVPVCDRNSPDVNDCLVEAVKKGLAAMKSGIKDLGVPAIDPYHQKELKMEYTNNQVSVYTYIDTIYYCFFTIINTIVKIFVNNCMQCK